MNTPASGVEEGPDKDGEGVPADYNITASSITVEKDGSVSGPDDAGTYNQTDGDPNDSDPDNPVPYKNLNATFRPPPSTTPSVSTAVRR